MANILLIDPNEVAQRAMRGILNRGHHRCAIAANAEDAWTLLREFESQAHAFSSELRQELLGRLKVAP